MLSSSAPSMGMRSAPTDVWRLSLCDDGGMPVTVSSFALSWLMVHDGVMRRSEAAFSETTSRGTSAMVSLRRLAGRLKCCRSSGESVAELPLDRDGVAVKHESVSEG